MKLRSSGRINVNGKMMNVVNRETKTSWHPYYMDGVNQTLAMMDDAITPCVITSGWDEVTVAILPLDKWKLVEDV